MLERPTPVTRLPCPWVPDGGAGAAIKAPGGTQLGLEREALLDAVQDRRCHVREALWGKARSADAWHFQSLATIPALVPIPPHALTRKA